MNIVIANYVFFAFLMVLTSGCLCLIQVFMMSKRGRCVNTFSFVCHHQKRGICLVHMNVFISMTDKYA